MSFLIVFAALVLYGQAPEVDLYAIGMKHTIYSKILQEDREILIHEPKGFWGMDNTISKYSVTFVLDGESQFLNAVAAIDFMSAAPMGNDLMPRTIVVGIPNTNRNRDLTPIKGDLGNDPSSIELTGGGPEFLDFIISELTPYIDSLYSTSEHRTIIGHSLGGLLVFEALLNNRAHFTNYLTIDPALSFDNGSYLEQVMDTLENANLSDETIFIATATTFPLPISKYLIENDNSELGKLTKTNAKFIKMARSANWDINFSYMDYPEETHFSIPYQATYDAMKFFYGFYQFKEMIHYYHPSFSDKNDLVEKLQQHYQEISKQLGYVVIPMESYINSWAFGLSKFGRSDLTLEMYDYSISLYPDRPSVYITKGRFLMNEGKKKEAISLFENSLVLDENESILKLIKELNGN